MDNLREERRQNLIDALSFKEPKKIPVGAEILTWPFSYAGVKIDDVMDNPEKAAKAYLKVFDDIEFDFLWGGIGQPFPHPLRVYQALGGTNYGIADDGVLIQHRQALLEFMSVEEYPELIADPAKFNQKRFKKLFKSLQLPRDEAYEKVKEALIAYKTHVKVTEMVGKGLENKGIVQLTGAPLVFLSPITLIFDNYRGMRNTLLDLRRQPDLLRQACEALLNDIRKNVAMFDPKDFTEPHPLAMTVYHAECFLSPEQFDEFFFNPFMELFMPFMEAGLKFFIKGEGRFLNTIDRYRKLPKGSCVFMLEEDDPFEMYKALGDWQVLGTGITADLLKMGTVQQCVDFVKRCFDEFAPGGGFIFLQNKPLLCGADAKIENIMAVYETANELSRK